ncbi:MAG TPA: hypothetical protein VF530_13195 [Planctomycetota bacterium]
MLRRAAPIVLLSALLGACASRDYSLLGSTPPGETSAVVVLGNRPSVHVVNGGPGELRVHIEGDSQRREHVLAMGEPAVEHTLRGPLQVRLQALGAQTVSWRVVAHRASGLRLDPLEQKPR